MLRVSSICHSKSDVVMMGQIIIAAVVTLILAGKTYSIKMAF